MTFGETFLYLLVILLTTTLAIITFIKRKNVQVRMFSYFLFYAASWVALGLLFFSLSNPRSVLLVGRLTFSIALLFAISFSKFIRIFPSSLEDSGKFISRSLINKGVVLFSLITFFTPLVIKNEIITGPGERDTIYGPLYGLWVVLIIFVFYLIISDLKTQYERSKRGIEKSQILYILIGAFFAITFGFISVIGLVSLGVKSFEKFGIPVSLLIFFLFSSYAILKYRLMDIRLALSRGLIYIFSLAVVIGLAFLLNFLVGIFIPSMPTIILMIGILILSTLLFPIILRFIEKLASRYFHYTFYNYQKILTDLGRQLTHFLNIDELSSLIVHTLAKTIKLERVVILLKKEDKENYIIQKNIGFREENGISLVKDNFLTSYLEKTQEPLVYEELSLIFQNSDDYNERKNIETLQDNMRRIEASLCIPLLIKNKISGIVVLGNKTSGDPYFEQDIDLLLGLSNQISIAIENAKLYSKVQDFSQNLEKKVEEQVRELRKTYRELEKAYRKLENLDKVKTEFMSIVSHQLRTPLSIIKGYLSMVLDGSFKNKPEKQKDVLRNIYGSNERLIRLVNDVLNISRIQAGKVQLNLTPNNIVDVTREVTSKMQKLAEEKNIKLIFKEPRFKYPSIYFDENKIENILINLIDNSIKYTSEGSVVLSIHKRGNSVEIMVKDTGAGMSKEEIEKLFETFRRGVAGQRFWSEGAGLGLYIAKQFIEMHEGTIKAKSDGIGKGSSFYVRLPIKVQV